MSTNDFYALLGITSTATEEEVRIAAKRRRIEVHPDRHIGKVRPAEALSLAQAVNAAADVLCDARQRSIYDAAHGHIDQIMQPGPPVPQYTTISTMPTPSLSRSTRKPVPIFYADHGRAPPPGRDHGRPGPPLETRDRGRSGPSNEPRTKLLYGTGFGTVELTMEEAAFYFGRPMMR